MDFMAQTYLVQFEFLDKLLEIATTNYPIIGWNWIIL